LHQKNNLIPTLTFKQSQARPPPDEPVRKPNKQEKQQGGETQTNQPAISIADFSSLRANTSSPLL
jgi:hypothetical protein